MQIKSFEEACVALGHDPATILPNVSMFPVKHQKALLAYPKLIIITACINKGWQPDWDNSDEAKYFPWFDMETDDNNPSGFRFYGTYFVCAGTFATGGSRLCFKTSKAAEYAGKQFLELWREMMVIEK